MLGEMFDLDQTSPNIAKHDVRSPNKVCKRSNISPNMMLGQMLGEMLDRLHRPLCCFALMRIIVIASVCLIPLLGGILNQNYGEGGIIHYP